MGKPVSLESSLEIFASVGPMKSPRDWDWMNGALALAVASFVEKQMEVLESSKASVSKVLPT
jgi:hypothetical protein